MNSSVFIPINPMSFGLTKRSFHNATHDSNELQPNFENTKSCILSIESTLTKNIRKVIEKFVNHFDNIKLLDAGNYNPDKFDLLNSTIDEIASLGCVPSLIGFDYQLVSEYIKQNSYSVFFITNDLPYINDEGLKNKNYLSYQRHLCRLEDIHSLEESSYNSLSLGKLRSNAHLLEPCLRDAEIVILDLKAIRSSDAPNVTDAIPSGLNIEELCQIFKFIGTSSRLKTIFIQADTINETSMQEAGLIAESLWYLYEGLNMKINDHPSTNKDFSAFVVHLNDIDLDIEFVRNNQSYKWWLKMEDNNQKINYLACSYEEYQQAISNDLPERILKFIHSLD